MKIGVTYGIVEKSKTRVECLFCGVCIPKAKKCIEQHCNGAKHKDNIELMNDEGIRYIRNKLHCKLCKRDLESEESVQKHTENDDHATWMSAVQELVDGEYINLQEYLSSDQDEVVCEACNCPFSFTLQAIEQHVNWFNHRSNLAEKLKPLNAMFPVDNDLEVWCKICNVHIDNNVQVILSHIDSDEEHVGWFEEMEDHVEEDGIDIEEYLCVEHKLTATCRLCNVELMCDIFTIENHIHGQMHLNNLINET